MKLMSIYVCCSVYLCAMHLKLYVVLLCICTFANNTAYIFIIRSLEETDFREEKKIFIIVCYYSIYNTIDFAK